MIPEITPLDTLLNEPTNQNSIKVLKVIKKEFNVILQVWGLV